jgi:hypothetical protein
MEPAAPRSQLPFESESPLELAHERAAEFRLEPKTDARTAGSDHPVDRDQVGDEALGATPRSRRATEAQEKPGQPHDVRFAAPEVAPSAP